MLPRGGSTGGAALPAALPKGARDAHACLWAHEELEQQELVMEEKRVALRSAWDGRWPLGRLSEELEVERMEARAMGRGAHGQGMVSAMQRKMASQEATMISLGQAEVARERRGHGMGPWRRRRGSDAAARHARDEGAVAKMLFDHERRGYGAVRGQAESVGLAPRRAELAVQADDMERARWGSRAK